MVQETLDPLREGRAASEISDRLVFYEVEGNRVRQNSEPVTSASPWATLNEQVKKQIKKAIQRSNGGFSTALPCHLIVEDQAAEHPVRVRVQFKDFKRDELGKVTKAEYAVQYKTVYPEELHAAETHVLRGDSVQRFLLDFGDGVVPVQPVLFDVNAKGEGRVYFIELIDVDNVRNGKAANKVWVRVHACDVSVLRFLPEGYRHAVSDFQKALANYMRLRKEGKRIIPQCLEVAPPYQVPGAMSLSELRDYLKVLISRQVAGKAPAARQFEIKEDELIPFGTYEDLSR